jgi:hypothetical protein
VLIAALLAPALALQVTIEAEVSADLREIRGVIAVDDPGVWLADPLALLPDAPDDRTTFRTWPGVPENGELSWAPAGEGRWSFTTRLPRRYGALGVLPWRGLWANGGWYPQPLIEGAVQIADWEVSVALPEGMAGAVGTAVGEGRVTWQGRGERAALAALKRGRIDTLVGEGVTITLLEDGPERPARDALLLQVFEDAWPCEEPGALTVIESPQLRRLVRPGPGTLFLSDRAFRATGRLKRFHRVGVSRGVLAAALPVEEPWARDIAADGFAREYRARVQAADVEDLLRWGAWIPEIDALLYDGSVPFVADLFVETFPGDPLQDDLLELFAPRTPGQVVAAKLDDRYGEGTAAAVGRRLLAGESLEEAAVTLGIAEGLAPWRAPYPEQDYRLEVSDATVRVVREAPPDAQAEPVVLEVDGERYRWLAGPGPDEETWILDAPPQRVALDPDRRLAQTDYVEERWPPRWTTTFAFFPYNINLSDQTLSLAATGVLRKQYDTRNLYFGELFINPVNRLGAEVTWRRSAGGLLDRRARPHRFYLSFSPAWLNDDYRPTPDGQIALGVSAAYSYDDRVDYHFPLKGNTLGLGVGAGFVPGSDQRWTSASASSSAILSPHPRHAVAVRARAGVAGGEVEHRLLGLGGSGALRFVPIGAAVGDWRALMAAEYRAAVIRNASVPLWLAWGSELQLTAGIEAGVLGDARLEDGGRIDLAQGVGWTAGVSGIGDLLGARPTMIGVTAAGPIVAEPAEIIGDFPVQIYLRWFQAF